MVDTNALRAAWVKRGLTQTEVAKKTAYFFQNNDAEDEAWRLWQ